VQGLKKDKRSYFRRSFYAIMCIERAGLAAAIVFLGEQKNTQLDFLVGLQTLFFIYLLVTQPFEKTYNAVF